jgi:predicted transcriptional regulator
MATSTKTEVLKMIDGMPENSSLDEIIYEIYFRKRVDRGLREMAKGKTVSHAEVESRAWRLVSATPSKAG